MHSCWSSYNIGASMGGPGQWGPSPPLRTPEEGNRRGCENCPPVYWKKNKQRSARRTDRVCWPVGCVTMFLLLFTRLPSFDIILRRFLLTHSIQVSLIHTNLPVRKKTARLPEKIIPGQNAGGGLNRGWPTSCRHPVLAGRPVFSEPENNFNPILFFRKGRCRSRHASK